MATQHETAKSSRNEERCQAIWMLKWITIILCHTGIK